MGEADDFCEVVADLWVVEGALEAEVVLLVEVDLLVDLVDLLTEALLVDLDLTLVVTLRVEVVDLWVVVVLGDDDLCVVVDCRRGGRTTAAENHGRQHPISPK